MSNLPTDEITVIFAGFDPKYDQGSARAFAFYDMNACWLPGTTSNPDVIKGLETLSLGHSFKIVSKRSDGPLGTIVDQIELIKDVEPYDRPRPLPALLPL